MPSRCPEAGRRQSDVAQPEAAWWFRCLSGSGAELARGAQHRAYTTEALWEGGINSGMGSQGICDK